MINGFLMFVFLRSDFSKRVSPWWFSGPPNTAGSEKSQGFPPKKRNSWEGCHEHSWTRHVSFNVSLEGRPTQKIPLPMDLGKYHSHPSPKFLSYLRRFCSAVPPPPLRFLLPGQDEGREKPLVNWYWYGLLKELMNALISGWWVSFDGVRLEY